MERNAFSRLQALGARKERGHVHCICICIRICIRTYLHLFGMSGEWNEWNFVLGRC